MANTLINQTNPPLVIAKMAMSEFKNSLVLGDLVNRDYEKEFKKQGDTCTYRRPIAYAAVDGPDITSANKDTVEGTDTMKLSFHKTVPLEFTTRDMTLTVEDFKERYVRPASIELAQQVESAIASVYSDFYWFSGTPGTTPSTFLSLGNMGNVLTNAAVPMGERVAVHDPNTALALSDGLKSVFVQNKVSTALEEQKIGRYARFDNYESVSLIRHTVGALGGTPLINGASQARTYGGDGTVATANVNNTANSGTLVKDNMTQTLITKGWTASVTGVLKKGDIFTIANVFAVNPKTRQSTGALQTFVVTADVNSDGSGNATLTIAPAMITSGAYQTVTAAPADSAAITVMTGAAGTQRPQSLCFHPKAITLACRPFEKPSSSVVFEQVDMDGFNITLSKGWDVQKYSETTRLDILFGVKVSDRRLGGRLTG